jgi:beta-phosphoglucomutase-like phosphatase (HAD superfamily)
MKNHPKNCVVIEDSMVGIEAALDAKMQVIGFLGGTHAKYDWYKKNVKAWRVPIAHDTNELLRMIG